MPDLVDPDGHAQHQSGLMYDRILVFSSIGEDPWPAAQGRAAADAQSLRSQNGRQSWDRHLRPNDGAVD